jgi:hypothetical protein
LGALYFFIKGQERRDAHYYVAFILAVYAFFIRTAGISLILAIAVFLLLRKQYKLLAIFLAIFLLVFVPWQIRNSSIPTENSYIDQLLAKNPYQMELGKIGFFDLFARAFDNFSFYAFTILPKTILPILGSNTLLAIFGFILLVLIIIGFIKTIKNFSIIEYYLVFGCFILFSWPKVWSSERFLLPLLPIMVIYILYGLLWLSNKVKSKYFMPILIGFIVFLNFLSIIPQAKTAIANNISCLKGDRYAGYTSDWRRYFEVVEWIEKNIPADEVIMARKPEFVYLVSGHKSVIYPFTANHTKVKEVIEQSDYILFDNFYWTGTTKRYLLPVLQQELSRYELVFQTRKPIFVLLRIKK